MTTIFSGGSSSAGGGGAATIADGADVAEGAKADAAWSGVGSGTVISILKKLATSGTGGGPATIADGADVAQGTTTDVAITADSAGTVIGFLRGLVKMFAGATAGGYIRQDSTSTIAKETGGNLATVKTNTDPLVVAAAGGYVRQDSTATIAKESGGNLAAIATSDASIDTKTPTVGQKTMAASSPVVLASDQSTLAISGTIALSTSITDLDAVSALYVSDHILRRQGEQNQLRALITSMEAAIIRERSSSQQRGFELR